jgi:hypothetical protein
VSNFILSAVMGVEADARFCIGTKGGLFRERSCYVGMILFAVLVKRPCREHRSMPIPKFQESGLLLAVRF